MKVTGKMVETFCQKVVPDDIRSRTSSVRPALEAVLRDVPDVVPFAFAGYPDNPVFLHRCGTVTDAREGTDLWDQVQVGECDCENTSPWLRIYVERPESA